MEIRVQCQVDFVACDGLLEGGGYLQTSLD